MNEYIEVRKCPHGKGVFAVRNFSEGELIAVVQGGTLKKEWTSKYDMKVGNDEYWSEFPPENPFSWSNSLDNSKIPNCRFTDFDVKNLEAKLMAIKKISAGEEMFINYKEIPKRLDNKK